jgi:hypothetical protein
MGFECKKVLSIGKQKKIEPVVAPPRESRDRDNRKPQGR